MTFDIVDLEKKMGQCLERLKKDFSTMRAGTANPAILDPIKVKAGNSLVSLRDVGQVSIKDAKTLMVNVNDPELIVAVEKAIREAGLNLNPIADNKAVKVPVPKPTKEFRETLSKNAAAAAEKSKTIIRKLRQDGMKDLKKDLKAGMSEDENFTLEKKAQALHDKVIKDIDEALKSKAKEIMSN
ncbi:ribosome recycling factor frr [Lobosporangium transversale]|uniref:Ribosome recycling factor frr n=1 Tax=Lobosporangium transversale TaxID=64571 RepID=A0A1Y2GMZ8_9FUNG|nr:ribosome recycling factor frr [Lobosporangium transversale]ORZ16087.1 ribosome recycling factor frr [Lobosporangium transversale]|eukprot:XP_021881434.1 ribosome recycling factor frr [Lobosporangium transversale]